MKNEAIKAELAELGVTDLNDDSARGIIYWPSYTMERFEEIAAIRAHANWDVTGKIGTRQGHWWPLSVTIDERRDFGNLTIGLSSWDFSLAGTAIKVINAAQSGELMVRFVETVRPTRHREVTPIKASSYLLVTDK